MGESMIKRIICIISIFFLLFSCFSIMPHAEKMPRDFTSNGNGGKTDVGTWFVTYNSGSEWLNNFGTGWPIKFRALLPDGSYGTLDSKNVEQIDFLLKQLADAKIDFILFDHTNGGLTEEVKYGWSETGRTVDKNVRLTCERISKWNEKHDWKIRYSIAVGVYEAIREPNNYSIGQVAEKQAKAVYNNYFKNNTYGDDYYTIDGKPLIILHHWGYNIFTEQGIGLNYYKGDRTYLNKFTVRNGQCGQPGTYGWDNRYGHIPHEEVYVVCPGHAVHRAEGALPTIRREQGQWYRTGWEILLNNESPRIVMIASFNDYHENTGVFTADTSRCKAEFDEQWVDVNGKLNASMYWDMTKEGINKLRVKNGDNIKGLDKSVAVKEGVYITVGEGVAKEPKEGAVKTTNIKVEKPKDQEKPDGSTTDDNKDDSQTDTKDSAINKNKDKKNEKTNKDATIKIIIVISTVILLIAAGVGSYFFIFRKQK